MRGESVYTCAIKAGGGTWLSYRLGKSYDIAIKLPPTFVWGESIETFNRWCTKDKKFVDVTKSAFFQSTTSICVELSSLICYLCRTKSLINSSVQKKRGGINGNNVKSVLCFAQSTINSLMIHQTRKDMMKGYIFLYLEKIFDAVFARQVQPHQNI